MPNFTRTLERILGVAMFVCGVLGLLSHQSVGASNLGAEGAAQSATKQACLECGSLLPLAVTEIIRTQSSSVSTNADAPHLQNANLESRSVSVSLDSTLRNLIGQAEKPEWIGYSVPVVEGQHSICCNHYGVEQFGCGTCRLEPKENQNGQVHLDHTEKLESSRQLIVLYRVEAKRIGQIRPASEECTLDAGGLSFIWLTGVNPAESVAWLKSFVGSTGIGDSENHPVAEGALVAIALHGNPAADHALESFVSPQQPESLRKNAAFWLGTARGHFGFITLQKMAKSDASTDIRAQVAFALSVSKDPGALDEMIRMAHEDGSAHVRGQALFWLAQKAGNKAAATITAAIQNDPDTEVKKHAVFALSQLPKDEGVPKLIEVAQNNRNPEVRKQAMFWLGQSEDARALQFFEKVLTQ